MGMYALWHDQLLTHDLYLLLNFRSFRGSQSSHRASSAVVLYFLSCLLGVFSYFLQGKLELLSKLGNYWIFFLIRGRQLIQKILDFIYVKHNWDSVHFWMRLRKICVLRRQGAAYRCTSLTILLQWHVYQKWTDRRRNSELTRNFFTLRVRVLLWYALSCLSRRLFWVPEIRSKHWANNERQILFFFYSKTRTSK